jgi:hypothetical protein
MSRTARTCRRDRALATPAGRWRRRADLFTRDQDVSAAKTRAALGWAPACTSIVTYLTA